MPRRKLGRLRANPPDHSTAEKYLLWLSNRRLFYEPSTLPKISSTSLFGNDHPMELEVGCGCGEFLCSLACERIETNFVGVDLHEKSLYKAVEEASSHSLDNILFINADFRLMYPLLLPASLLKVYLNFPDPGAKATCRSKRMFSQRFVDEVYRVLLPEGRLSVRTDHGDYFDAMLSLVEHDTRWKRLLSEHYLVGFESGVKSRFQRLWESRDRSILHFELGKRNTVA